MLKKSVYQKKNLRKYKAIKDGEDTVKDISFELLT